MAESEVNKKQSSNNWLKQNRRFMLMLGPLVIIVISAYFYITGGRFIGTDDAYVQSARTDISSNIAGRVTEIAVHDNQQVHRGDLLFKLDDRDLRIAVESAKAELENAKMQVAALKATYSQQQNHVQAAQETADYYRKEYERQKNLAAQGISSQTQLDEAEHAYRNAQQQIAIKQDERKNVLASLNGQVNPNINQHPAVLKAQAALDQAELNLSYATVRASVDGIVTKVDQLQSGSYIQAASPVFALMSKNIWIEANFKETELTYMHPGQNVTIEIDTYPGHEFHGKVLSLSPGTGSSFSILPPENATGNWVKVVQRLPVRISIDDADANVRLHAGLSALVKVDTQHSRLKSLTHG